MNLYLLRHTRTAMPAGSCYGFHEAPLAPDYPAEFAAVRERVLAAGLTAPRIISSPLTRCRRLAEDLEQDLARTFGRVRDADEGRPRVLLDERLKELNFGEWEGRAWDEIQATDSERARAWMNDFVETPCPGGESYRDLADRTSAWLDSLPGPDDALIVAHGGSIRALLVRLLGLEPGRGFRFEIEYGRLSCVEWQPGHSGLPARLLYLNR